MPWEAEGLRFAVIEKGNNAHQIRLYLDFYCDLDGSDHFYHSFTFLP